MMTYDFGNIALALSQRVPPQVDFHLHTTWTDGAHTVNEMFDACGKRGLREILFSEHARASSGDWFPAFAAEVRALPRDMCSAYVGTEVKIADYSGELDICDEVRRNCDLIMASVHRFPEEINVEKGQRPTLSDKEAVDREFTLARTALRRGGFDILGHPFGMSYRRFGCAPSESLVTELMHECRAAGIAFEVNARYHPDPWRLIAACLEIGAPISLGSNAHHIDEVGKITRILDGSEKPWMPSGLS